MKYSKLVALSLLVMFIITGRTIAVCQTRNTKMDFGALLGAEHSVATRGPRTETPVSKVHFLRPITKTFGFRFNIYDGSRFSYGAEFFYDEFDYGYDADNHLNNTRGGLTSGLLAANDRLVLYKAGIRVGYALHQGKRFTYTAVIIPSIGYYPYSTRMNDTSGNEFWNDPRSEIKFRTFPAVQYNGIKFLLKSSVEMSYSFQRRFNVFTTLSYQQGFSPFLIDTTNIQRPYEPTGPKEYKYWTRLNGSAIQWHFGLKYSIWRRNTTKNPLPYTKP